MASAPFRLAPAWQREDFALQRAAIDYWLESGLLPAGVDARARARQLTVVAFAGEIVAGVATAIVRPMPQVKAKLAMFRCSVAPEHRRSGVAAEMAAASRDLIEAWAKGNPQFEVQGMGCVVQGAELQLKKEQAVWPISGLNLVGYNARGEQVRVVWFKGARVL